MQRIHIFILMILAMSSLAAWALVFVLRGSQADPVAATPHSLPAGRRRR